MEKYVLSEHTMIYNVDQDDGTSKPTKLYRIRALRDIGQVAKKGDLGGFVQSEKNLSQNGDCWVDQDCIICGDAVVKDDSIVRNTRMYGGSTIGGRSTVEQCVLYETSFIENSTVYNAKLTKDSYICRSMVSNTFVNLVDCNIQKTSDLITISGAFGFSKEDKAIKVSFYRNRSNNIFATYNTYVGILCSFEDYVLENCSDDIRNEWITLLTYVKMHFGILDDSEEYISTSKQYKRSVELHEERKAAAKQQEQERPKVVEDKPEKSELTDKQKELLIKKNAMMLNKASQMIIMATDVINAANDINQELIKTGKIGFDTNKED